MTANEFLRKYSPKAFAQATALLLRILPIQSLYAILFHFNRMLALLLRPLIQISPYRSDPRRNIIVAWLMNSWLQPLTRRRLIFPIPIRAHGEAVVAKASRNPGGMLVCSVHLPLVNGLLRPLVDMGITPAAVVALTEDNDFPVWGSDQGIPALAPGGNVLLKVKTILRHGGTVAVLVDPGPNSPLNPNIFHLIKHVGAEVVFAIVELQPNGEILVRFSTPPDPFCRTAKSIDANLRALRDQRHCVLNPSPRRVAAEKISLLSSDDTEPAKTP